MTIWFEPLLSSGKISIMNSNYIDHEELEQLTLDRAERLVLMLQASIEALRKNGNCKAL